MFRLRICLFLCLSAWQALLAQPNTGDLYQQFQQARVRLDYKEALELCGEILLAEPARLQDLIQEPSFYELSAVQSSRVALSKTAILNLLRMQGFISWTEELDRSFWIRQRSLTVLFYPVELKDSVRNVLQTALEDDFSANGVLCLDAFGESLLAEIRQKKLTPVEAVNAFIFWDKHYRNLDIWMPELRTSADDLHLLLLDVMSTLLPSCVDLQKEFQVRLDRSLLRPDEYQYLYTALRVQRCTQTAFVDTVERRISVLISSAYFLRLVGDRYLQTEKFQQAQSALEKAVELSEEPRLKAKNLLLLAEMYALRKSFRTARLLALQADQSYPDWGEPWLFQAELVLKSAPFCNFSDLERKALNWLAIDFCEKAQNVNPALDQAAQSRISYYMRNCPEQEELRFHGFQVGDRFPIPCWIGETTKVRY